MRSSFLVIMGLVSSSATPALQGCCGEEGVMGGFSVPAFSFYSHGNAEMGCVIIFAMSKVRLREVYQLAWDWLASK